MTPTISVDVTKWRAAANELFKTETRSLVDFVNGQALRVATFALKETKQADKDAVAKELGRTGFETRIIRSGKRKGKKVRGRATYAEDSLAQRILLKRFRDTGKWSAGGKDLDERVRAFIGRRLAAISFIRSGWIPAVLKLASVVYQKTVETARSKFGAKQAKSGVEKGTARPARFSFLPKVLVCEIENDIPGHVKGTEAVAVAGLQKALNMAAKDMIQKLAQRLKRVLKQFGAK